MVTGRLGGASQLLDERLLAEHAERDPRRLAVLRADETEPGMAWLWKAPALWVGVVRREGSRGDTYRRHRQADEAQYQIAGHRTLVTQRGVIALEPGRLRAHPERLRVRQRAHRLVEPPVGCFGGGPAPRRGGHQAGGAVDGRGAGAAARRGRRTVGHLLGAGNGKEQRDGDVVSVHPAVGPAARGVDGDAGRSLRLDEAAARGGQDPLLGPTPDHQQGIYVINVGSREEAERIAASDPFTACGGCTYQIWDWELHEIMGVGRFERAPAPGH